VFVIIFFIIQLSKMHGTEEPVLVSVRVRPLSTEESKKNAVSVVQVLPHEPKVSFVLVHCHLNNVSKTWLETVKTAVAHL
jgi:hypothetical protein